MSRADWLMKSRPDYVFKPRSIDECQDFIKSYSGHISIAGSQFSSGGQTLIDDGVIISLKNYWIDIVPKFKSGEYTYVVSGGATWEQILTSLTKYGLVPMSMQSYHNFSVGGTISVNAHGRNGKRVSDSIIWLKVILSSGKIVKCYPTSEIFQMAVGGYGLIGLIVEAKLIAQQNKTLKCEVLVSEGKNISLEINDILSTNPGLYNSELNGIGELVHICWYDTNRVKNHVKLTQKSNMISHTLARFGETLLNILPGTSELYHIYSWMNLNHQTRSLSYEMGYDAKDLVPLSSLRLIQSLLQEYFIPKDRLDEFIHQSRRIFKKYPEIEIINLSIRHLDTDRCGILDWLPETESFAVVIYLSVNNTIVPGTWSRYSRFTKTLVNISTNLGGTWYLPYCPEFTHQDLCLGYPQLSKFIKLKDKYDPQHTFNSKFWTRLLKVYFQ